jgi:hypothetical protein
LAPSITEPGLAPHEDIAPPPKQPVHEFTFTAEKSDDEAARAELLRLRTRGLARQVGTRTTDWTSKEPMRTKHTFRLPPDLAISAARKRVPCGKV